MTNKVIYCLFAVLIKSELLLPLPIFSVTFFSFSFFLFHFFLFKFRIIIFFYPKPLFPRWAMWLQSNGLFFSSKNSNTGDRGGSGHRFLEILKKEHVQIQGGVFMKNSWNFHWLSWFRLWNFNQQGVSHYFAEFAGVKGCFFLPKVTYLKISVFFRKVFTGIEIRENVVTNQFTNLLKSVFPLRHDFFDFLAF